jgi:fimbrial chaperone protein
MRRIILKSNTNQLYQSGAVFLMALIFPALAGAASWEINPVRVELSSQQQTAAVTIRNDTDQATSIQINALAWSQEIGMDSYTPTNELLVSPPIVTIAPNSEQIVRVALRRQADASNELTYRISLQELPSPPVVGFQGVKVALRVTLPVFVQSQTGKAAPKIDWTVSRQHDNSLKVVMRNRGNAHIQISDFALYLPGHTQPLANEEVSSYVLSGQSHEWLLKTSDKEKMIGNRLRLKAFTDAANIDTEIVLRKP